MPRFLTRSILASALLWTSSAALAQESDLPDDIFGDDTAPPEPTNRQEKEALLAEEEAAVELPEEQQRRRVIQTFQRKNFMKIGRYELSPALGFVTNDPFINRYLGSVAFAYHATEVFALEGSFTFSPNLGTADYKAVTEQIINENGVTPDISKIQLYGNVNFQFSPIYGKIALGHSRIIGFDIFGVFGTGAVQTLDDLEALGKTTDARAIATQSQWHPSLTYGGGLRVVFNETFAARLEGRGLSYIEVIESDTLEMKNNFTLIAGGSIFFPGMD
ncbi:MAG: outer membrane beta-barrel domain-containing protein [Myxococcota bacterium]